MAKKKKNVTLPKTDAVNGVETAINSASTVEAAAVSSTQEPSFPSIVDREPGLETRNVIEEETVLSVPEAATTKPTYEVIALHAYQIAIARGGTPGHELEDWLQAERALGVTSNV